MADTQEEKERLEQQLNGTEKDLSGRLATTQQLLSERTKELDELRIQWNAKSHETKEQYDQQINREKEVQNKLHNSYEERLQSERMTFEERYNKSVRELENRLRESQSANKELTTQKYKYESLIREIKSRVTTLEEERQVVSKDVQQLRRQNTNLDSDRHERDKTLNHLRTRVAVLEQELKDKEQVIQRTNELFETSHENKNRQDVELENKCNHVKQLENTVRSVSGEVIKGNEIIQKLQAEIKNLKSRVKMMNIVTTKQEKLIGEKELVLNQRDKEIQEDKISLKDLQEELVKLKKNMEDTSQKFNESQETLKNNENVINWLNKQLNDQTITKLSSTHNNTTFGRIPYNGRSVATSNTSVPHINQSTNFHPRLGGHIASNAPSAVPPRIAQQLPYRPILKKPQFQTDGISPIVPQQVRNPLRLKQVSTPVIREETEPVLDPKYLMRRKPEQHNYPNADLINKDENTDPNALETTEISQQRTAKPFIVASSYFPTQ